MMGTKNNPGAFDCYANAAPDEPMFVLLGRDPFAAALVRLWAKARGARDDAPEKVAEAWASAESMEAWCKDVAGREPVDILAVNDLLANAAEDSDPVSAFVVGTKWEDATAAIFVTKGGECSRDVRNLLNVAGLITDKPVADQAPVEATL